MNLGRRLKAGLGFAWSNLDAILIVLIAFGVALAEVVAEPKPELVNTAILAVIGAIAIVLLRDRGRGASLDTLAQIAEDSISDRPYVVVWQYHHWDLVDRDTAIVTGTDQIRFTRDQVATNFFWSISPGTVESVESNWRRDRKSAWLPAEKVHEFATRGGTKEIFCYNAEHNRGEMLEWKLARKIRGQFPDKNEGIDVEAATKSDHPRALRITWPKGSPPSRVEIRVGNHPARALHPKFKDGRASVEEKVHGLGLGEHVKIEWYWD